MRPKLGLSPTSPVHAAGIRIEPPPSPPVAIGTMPPATADAEPPLDPPGVTAGSHGLRVTPQAGLAVKHTDPNSGTAVLPTGTAPAARSRATSTASSPAGGPSLKSNEPFEVVTPSRS